MDKHYFLIGDAGQCRACTMVDLTRSVHEPSGCLSISCASGLSVVGGGLAQYLINTHTGVQR